MGKIRIVSGDVTAGLYEARDLAVGLQRVEESIAVLGATVLGSVTLTLHLLDGGTAQAVADRDTWRTLQAYLADPAKK